jgi:hypothetical protein
MHNLSEHHTQVETALQVAETCVKQRDDKVCTPLFFQSGDLVVFILDKDWFQWHHHNLHPLRYDPYTILERIRENAYRLDLSTMT